MICRRLKSSTFWLIWVITPWPWTASGSPGCHFYYRKISIGGRIGLTIPAYITSGGVELIWNIDYSFIQSPTTTITGGLIIRNAAGYFPEATFDSPLTNFYVKGTYFDINSNSVKVNIAKTNDVVFEAANNTTCVIVFSNGTVVEFSAEL